jgi:hypothetical protein
MRNSVSVTYQRGVLKLGLVLRQSHFCPIFTICHFRINLTLLCYILEFTEIFPYQNSICFIVSNLHAKILQRFYYCALNTNITTII